MANLLFDHPELWADYFTQPPEAWTGLVYEFVDWRASRNLNYLGPVQPGDTVGCPVSWSGAPGLNSAAVISGSDDQNGLWSERIYTQASPNGSGVFLHTFTTAVTGVFMNVPAEYDTAGTVVWGLLPAPSFWTDLVNCVEA